MRPNAKLAAWRMLAPIALVVSMLAAPAPAQGGYTSEKRPDLGLGYKRARDYEEIPIPPDEEFAVLYFGEKVSTDPKKRRSIRPLLSFLWIERVPDPGQRTGFDPAGGSSDPPEDGDDEKDEPPVAKPINSIERYLESRYREWKLGKPVEGKERAGYASREFTITPKKGAGAGWVYSYESPKRTIAILGLCDERDLKEQVDIWRFTAEHLDIKEPEEKSAEKLQLYYARKPLKAIDFRIGVRQKLVRGWKVEDTDNYIVVYDTPDEPLLRRIVRDLELVRKEYEKLFPPAKPVEAVSTVRVCKHRDEYMSYGGPPRSAGYWNWNAEELVFYDAEKVDKQHRSSDADTFIVLYHEAFHQFIHYSTGELPPHSWFNEGHGDYFSGAQIKDGKLRGIGPNPWRVHTIHDAIDENKFIPWEEMIRFEQPQYYRQDIVHICYAQGWSMVYFLRKSPEVAKRPEWAKILPTYFSTLKESYGEALASLEAAGKKDDGEAKAKAGLAARNKAIDAAFDGVDLGEIQDAWVKFTSAVDDPYKKK